MDKISTLQKTLKKFDQLVSEEIVTEGGWMPAEQTVKNILTYSKTTFVRKSEFLNIIEVKLN